MICEFLKIKPPGQWHAKNPKIMLKMIRQMFILIHILYTEYVTKKQTNALSNSFFDTKTLIFKFNQLLSSLLNISVYFSRIVSPKTVNTWSLLRFYPETQFRDLSCVSLYLLVCSSVWVNFREFLLRKWIKACTYYIILYYISIGHERRIIQGKRL